MRISDKPVEFDEHAILIDSTDNLVGCIKYKIIFSTFESSMFVNKIENYPFEKCIQVDPCTTPKNVCDASLQPTFKEYLAEMNGNSLFVRVSKNSHLVERIYDANDHKSGI